MFHWQDETYFGRRKDGSVRILKFSQPFGGWPDPEAQYPEAEIDLTIPDNHWGSVVASVSHAGEENGRWYQAMKFHNGTTVGDTTTPLHGREHNFGSTPDLSTLEQIGQLADKADNFLAATNLSMPAEFHLKQLKVGLKEISDALKAIYEGITDLNPWSK